MTRDKVVKHWTGEIKRMLIDQAFGPDLELADSTMEREQIEAEGWAEVEKGLAEIVGLALDAAIEAAKEAKAGR